MPVIPMSVSTVTTMLLWLNRGLKFGGRKILTRVILALGRSADASNGSNNPSAGAAARARKNDLRFISALFSWLRLGPHPQALLAALARPPAGCCSAARDGYSRSVGNHPV